MSIEAEVQRRTGEGYKAHLLKQTTEAARQVREAQAYVGRLSTTALEAGATSDEVQAAVNEGLV